MAALTHTGDARTHTLSVLVENRAGVLTRIAGMFARRGFNIYSLAVAPTDDERFSRITIVVDVESKPLEQITKQLHKLINVIKISELGPGEAVERELMLVTLKSTPESRTQVKQLADLYDAEVLDVGVDSMTLSLDAEPGRIDDFEELCRPYGIVTVQRTGRVALPVLSKAASR
jgi:acetolactate synthase I/III small subunit